MTWWRVELDEHGKVLRLKRCSDGGPGTMTVFYVRAQDENAARQAAYQERQKMLLKARRKAYVEQGLCRCGREREDKSKTRCETCRERQRRYAKRLYEKTHGRPIETPSKSETFLRRHASVRESERLATLLEVRENWIEMGDSGRFSKWLKTEIERLTKREAA